MPLRGIARLAIVLGLVSLCTLPAGALEPAKNEAVELELPRERKQRRLLEEFLGRGRVRRLQKANFRIAYYAEDSTPRLSDLPEMQEEVAEALLASLGRIAHKAVLAEMRLEERRDALRGKMTGYSGESADPGHRAELRVSPQFRWESNAWMGAKLGLKKRGARLLSAASLRVGCEVDGHNPSIKLDFEERSRRAFLQYNGDHKKYGRSIELQVGFSF